MISHAQVGLDSLFSAYKSACLLFAGIPAGIFQLIKASVIVFFLFVSFLVVGVKPCA